MRRANFCAYYSLAIAAILILTACGLQNGIQLASPVADVESHTPRDLVSATARVDRATSRETLIYVSSPSKGEVFVYNNKNHKLVQKLGNLYQPFGECVDDSGDVFIVTQGSPSSSGSNVYEYAHGGSSPIAVLADPGYGQGCSVDSQTGNLAVANPQDFNNPYYHNNGDVAIYASSKGQAIMHYTSQFSGFGSCGYDNAGNLYLEALTLGSSQHITLARLTNASSAIGEISVNKNIYSGYLFIPSVQWDGSHITISTAPQAEGRKGSGVISIYQLAISGSNGTVIGTTKLDYKKNRHRGQTWIYDGSIFGIDDYKGGNVSSWRYPLGGHPQSTIKSRETDLWGVVVSPPQTL